MGSDHSKHAQYDVPQTAPPRSSSANPASGPSAPVFTQPWFLRVVECPICMEVPRYEIFLCSNGHPICRNCYHTLKTNKCPNGRCDYPEVPIRSRALEDLIEEYKFLFVCKNQDIGCKEKHPKFKIDAHELLHCNVKEIKCPAISECPVRCSRRILTKHMHDCHQHQVRDGFKNTYNITRKTLNSDQTHRTCAVMHTELHMPYFSRLILAPSYAMLVIQVDRHHKGFAHDQVAQIKVRGRDGASLVWIGSPYDIEHTEEYMLEEQRGLCISKKNLEKLVGLSGRKGEKEFGVLTADYSMI